MYNLAKRSGPGHRNAFNKTARVFGLKGDSNWMCPGTLDRDSSGNRDSMNLNHRTRFLM